ncbi:ribonuclease T2 family protein [Pseudaminobacter soli (ex Li et al. 2025)]|uniref:Ribonuclease n=1 Tax=Pseudaminobacter soli (ex Li et al. 2025) TaxID=1295366 RepID=A0A2P7SFU7_9HYPH|nr:ribonuclease [Mesorhizobium soli]PSJ61221.1 ribonuclease [Mesorhizobium soli]
MTWTRNRRQRAGIAAGLGLALLACVAGCKPAGNSGQNGGQAPAASSVPIGSGFDFYVLSLSWSPSYCEAGDEENNSQQCRGGRPYAFVVHGLWPQYERGYPQDCQTDQPRVPTEAARSMLDIMPAIGLVGHEWRKHGSCSGLDQGQYFEVLRAARDKVNIPPEYRRLQDYLTPDPNDVERAFLRDNAGIPEDGIAVTCDRRYLREVRICMTKDLSFRTCDEVDRRAACRLPKVVMPPVRGG